MSSVFWFRAQCLQGFGFGFVGFALCCSGLRCGWAGLDTQWILQLTLEVEMPNKFVQEFRVVVLQV